MRLKDKNKGDRRYGIGKKRKIRNKSRKLKFILEYDYGCFLKCF